MSIDWTNPTEDQQKAFDVGHAEATGIYEDKVARLTTELAAAQAVIDKLREAIVAMLYNEVRLHYSSRTHSFEWQNDFGEWHSNYPTAADAALAGLEAMKESKP